MTRLAIAALSLWLAACSGGPATPPFSGTTSPSSLAPAPDPARGVALMTGASLWRERGFDRLQFDFAAVQRPELRAEYVTQAFQCGSGEPEPVAGTAVLLLTFQPADAHDDRGNATVSTRRLSGVGGSVRQAVIVCDFEAHVQWALGVDGRRAYRLVPIPGSNGVWVDVER